MSDILLPAPAIARGVCRLFGEMGCGTLTEFTIANGRRLDVLALHGDGRLTGVEIKSGVRDFRADRKWRDYLDFCDAFYFAVSEDFPLALLPDECGIVVADTYAATVLRAAPSQALHAARRKAVTLRFALTASARLRGWEDPQI